MTNILVAEVSVRGTRPLLWHAFTPDAIPASGKRERTGVAGNDPSEWRRTVLADSEGRLYLEPTYVFGCVRDGARHTKYGRGSLQPMIAATLQVLDDRVFTDRTLPDDPATDPTLPVYLDIRSVRNPATKGRNVRYRVAAAAGWTLRFTLMWDMTVVSREQMRAVVRDAGMFAGLGDARAIGFGRFGVEEFAIGEHDEYQQAKTLGGERKEEAAGGVRKPAGEEASHAA